MPLAAAYIVPHPPLAVPAVGRGEERAIADTLSGYRDVASRIAALAPDDIVIISPHTAYYADWIYMAPGDGASGDLAQFRAPDVRIALTYDVDLRERIEGAARAAGIPAGVTGTSAKPLDHGMMVPLYYIDATYPVTRYKAVSIGGSALSREQLYDFGKCIADACEASGRKCVLLVSGDLSHKLKDDGPYGFDPAGPVFDDAFVEVVRSGDSAAFMQLDPQMCEDAAECGLSGFVMMAGALARAEELSGEKFTSELISHEGPFGVGYGVAAFEHEGACEHADASSEQANITSEQVDADTAGASADPLVALAKSTIEEYVRNGTTPYPTGLPPDVPARAGCFVSIHTVSTGDLRGCIGTIAPVQPTLAEEIVANAVSASTRDPRFLPIAPEELGDLRINVDVLFPPEPATLADMDVKRYGIIVSKDWRRGLLLPDLEGVDTVEQQYEIACRKGGIDPAEPGIEIERFEVVRHE